MIWDVRRFYQEVLDLLTKFQIGWSSSYLFHFIFLFSPKYFQGFFITYQHKIGGTFLSFIGMQRKEDLKEFDLSIYNIYQLDGCQGNEMGNLLSFFWSLYHFSTEGMGRNLLKFWWSLFLFADPFTSSCRFKPQKMCWSHAATWCWQDIEWCKKSGNIERWKGIFIVQITLIR